MQCVCFTCRTKSCLVSYSTICLDSFSNFLFPRKLIKVRNGIIKFSSYLVILLFSSETRLPRGALQSVQHMRTMLVFVSELDIASTLSHRVCISRTISDFSICSPTIWLPVYSVCESPCLRSPVGMWGGRRRAAWSLAGQ